MKDKIIYTETNAPLYIADELTFRGNRYIAGFALKDGIKEVNKEILYLLKVSIVDDKVALLPVEDSLKEELLKRFKANK